MNASETLLGTLPVHKIKKLGTCYPTEHIWAADTGYIYDHWEGHLKTVKLADERTTRKGIELIDRRRMRVVNQGEQACFLDVDTKEIIALIYRNWCPQQEDCKQVDQYCKDYVKVGESIRVCFP